VLLLDVVHNSPPIDMCMLPRINDIQRKQIEKENNIPTYEDPFTMDDIRNADEVIVSSSACIDIRAVEIDGQPVGGKDGKTLKILQDAYAKKYNAETVSR